MTEENKALTKDELMTKLGILLHQLLKDLAIGNDMLALSNRLVELDKDGEFFNFAFCKWMNSEGDNVSRSKMSNFHFHWLIPRFAELVVEFLRKEIEK